MSALADMLDEIEVLVRFDPTITEVQIRWMPQLDATRITLLAMRGTQQFGATGHLLERDHARWGRVAASQVVAETIRALGTTADAGLKGKLP